MTTGIEHARGMLDQPTAATVSVWPRAAAVLARQDLEQAIDDYWERVAPQLRWTPMRPQLSCLQVYLPDRGAAAEIAFAWHGLSRATHHRPYELDPTRVELTWLIEAAQRGIDRLGATAERAQG